jgi:Fe2+ or Zn2+ uptake regulation protein
MVYDAIRDTQTHPTADWIFEKVRSEVPKISLGTVYRNLTVLKEDGLIRELTGVDRRARYEAAGEPHAHFVCTDCGEIRDVDVRPEVEWRTLRELVGCDVLEQRLEFHGVCAACQRQANH